MNEALPLLLVSYAGAVAINTLIAAILWFRNRDTLHWWFLATWVATLVTFICQGVFQQFGTLGLTIGMIPSFLITVSLVFLILQTSEIVDVKVPWKSFSLLYFLSVVVSIYFALNDYSFTQSTFPFIFIGAMPMFWLFTVVLKKGLFNNLSLAAKGLLLSAFAYQIHFLDFPFLRDKPAFAAPGFMLALLIIFSLSIFAIFAVLQSALDKQYRVATELDTLNRELERRVKERSDELKQNFAKLQEIQKKKILQDERERVIMDMHDGVGGQLVATLAMIDLDTTSRNDIKRAVGDTLEEVRFIINAADTDGGDISIMLGEFRQRLEKTLAGTGTKLHWQVEDVPTIPHIGQHNVLHLLRILQEAFSNAIKYASAKNITVAASEKQNKVLIEITDDGEGMHLQPNSKGKGFSNMRRRAQRLSAHLDILDNHPGVTVRLAFDLSGPITTPVSVQ